MFESLFGAETPLAVRFFIAFVVVFGLIGAAAWAVRRFGVARLGGQSARGRQPRLAVIEAGAVDGRRRLVLIRRDNVEHLLMIGGPTDIVVEQNIVRGQREAAQPRSPAVTEPLPRALPLGDNATTWPLAPEPGPRPRPVMPEDTLQWNMPAEPVAPPPPPPAPSLAPAPAARRQRAPADTLAGLAQELARPNGYADAAPAPAARPAPPIERHALSLDHVRPGAAPVHAQQQPAQPAYELQPDARHHAGANGGGDANLAEMAQRLEAALRRPGGAASARQPLASAPRIDSVNGGGHDHAATLEAAPAQDESAAAFGSLEQEMASLLGRPPGKA